MPARRVRQSVVLDRGTVLHSGPAQALRYDSELLEKLLGVAR